MGNTWVSFRLRNRTRENTPEYGCSNKTMIGKIVSVYDGDTCRVVIRLNGEYQVVKIRCCGYDSPEMKPLKNNPERLTEIAAAKRAKVALESLILDKIVILEMRGFDKYGRFLATIFVKQSCRGPPLNTTQYMIDNGFGVPYNGRTKGIHVVV